MKRTSMILMSDFYKQAHAEQYPKGLTKLISYATARMSRIPKEMYGDKLIVFGIQAYVKDFLIERFNETFFNVPLEEAMQEYKDIIGDTFPIQYVDTGKFEALHKLGYLPVEICALPEGCRVPIRSVFELPEGQCQVPFMSIVNTHPDFPWITEFLESVTSSEIWYPMAVANQAYYYRQIANEWYEKTGCGSARSAISEFGYRGGKSSDASIKASAAFLTSFNKTATIPAIKYVRDYYGDNVKDIGSGMISTEHSVMCSNYAVDSKPLPMLNNDREYLESKDTKTEAVFLKRLLSELYPTGNVSVVMDTYDYWANLQRCGKGNRADFNSLSELYNYFKDKCRIGLDERATKDRASSVVANIRYGTKVFNVEYSEIHSGFYRELEARPKKGYKRYNSLEELLNNFDFSENAYYYEDNKYGFIAEIEIIKEVDSLYDIIMNREGTVFFRGDSGDPVDIICGKQVEMYDDPALVVLAIKTKKLKAGDVVAYRHFMNKEEGFSVYRITESMCEQIERTGSIKGTVADAMEKLDENNIPVEYFGTVELLWEMFGGTVNEKGYKVLDSHVRAIYGDSITPKRAREIYQRLAEKGFAACNVALGAGSFSMQCAETEDGRLLPFTRDTYGIAVKTTWCQHINGEEYQLFKNPKTDTGKFKKSQKGLIYVTEDEKGEIIAEDGYTSKTIPKYNMLQPIFRDGKMLNEISLEKVRNRLHNNKF